MGDFIPSNIQTYTEFDIIIKEKDKTMTKGSYGFSFHDLLCIYLHGERGFTRARGGDLHCIDTN